MKKNIINVFTLFLFISLISCEERIEMDMNQWGDHAYIDNAQVFTLAVAEHQLQEYYVSGDLTPARQRQTVSLGDAIIDSINFTATIKVETTQDLSRLGIVIYHKASKVEPLNGTPKAGILSDLSSKGFKYRLISADGTKHDWNIVITQ